MPCPRTQRHFSTAGNRSGNLLITSQTPSPLCHLTPYIRIFGGLYVKVKSSRDPVLSCRRSAPDEVFLPIANWQPKDPPEVGDDIGPQIHQVYEVCPHSKMRFATVLLLLCSSHRADSVCVCVGVGVGVCSCATTDQVRSARLSWT